MWAATLDGAQPNSLGRFFGHIVLASFVLTLVESIM